MLSSIMDQYITSQKKAFLRFVRWHKPSLYFWGIHLKDHAFSKRKALSFFQTLFSLFARILIHPYCIINMNVSDELWMPFWI